MRCRFGEIVTTQLLRRFTELMGSIWVGFQLTHTFKTVLLIRTITTGRDTHQPAFKIRTVLTEGDTQRSPFTFNQEDGSPSDVLPCSAFSNFTFPSNVL